jgi:hypothetical protein
MMTQDSRSANYLISETAEVQDSYELLTVAADFEQVLRKNMEDVVLRDSMETFGKGAITIDIPRGRMVRAGSNPQVIYSNGNYDDYKESLEEKIHEKVLTYYYNGDEAELDNLYSSPSLNYDFSRFIERQDDFNVTLDRDSQPDQRLGGKIEFTRENRGFIGMENAQTGSKLSIKTKAEVESRVRPFTIHDKSMGFVDSIDDNDVRWTLWGILQAISMLEANTKHEVSIASDPKVSYTLAHALLIWKEQDEFGSFDYVHIPYEIVRPWIGSSDGSTDINGLLSTLREMDEAGYVDKVQVMERDLEEVKNLFDQYAKPASIGLWKARTKFGEEVEKRHLLSRSEATLGGDETEFSDGSTTRVEDYLREATRWEIEQEDIDDIINSINAGDDRMMIIGNLTDLNIALQIEYEDKKRNLSSALSNLVEAKNDLSNARNDLISFKDNVNCDNQFIGYAFFAFEDSDGGTLNQSLVEAIGEIQNVENNLDGVKSDINTIQSSFDTGSEPLYISTNESLYKALQFLRVNNRSDAIEVLENARDSLEQLRGQIDQEDISQIEESLNISAKKIFEMPIIFVSPEPDDVMRPVLTVYQLTKNIKNIKDELGNIGDQSKLGEAVNFLIQMLNPIMESIDRFSSLQNLYQSAEISIPNKEDQILSIVPPPPWEGFGGGQELSTWHNIWWQTKSTPFSISIPFLGNIPPSSTNSFQIPYTPININLFKYNIAPLHENGDEDEETISSHLRVIDFRNSHIGEVLDFEMEGLEGLEDFNGLYPVPIKYHRYIMYHYNFTAPTITPPIPIIPLSFTGPFTQDLHGPYIPTNSDPADVDYTLTVSLDDESCNDEMPINYSVRVISELPEDVSLEWKLTDFKEYTLEEGSEPVNPTTRNLCESGSCTDNLNEYGWDIISLQTNTSDDMLAFASIVVMKQNFIEAMRNRETVVTLERLGGKIRVQNNRDIKFEVTVKASTPDGTCCWIGDGDGNWTNPIILDIGAGETKELDYKTVGEGDVQFGLQINLPQKVVQALGQGSSECLDGESIPIEENEDEEDDEEGDSSDSTVGSTVIECMPPDDIPSDKTIVHFATQSDTPTDSELFSAKEWLGARLPPTGNIDIVILGFADKQQWDGGDSEKKNMLLSIARAINVKSELGGVLDGRVNVLNTMGCGDKFAPEVSPDNDSPEDRVAVIKIISESDSIFSGIECSWCPEKVVPVRVMRNVFESNQIDVIFIPDTSYQDNFNLFVDDLNNAIREGYFKISEITTPPLPSDYKDRFNFYYYTGGYGNSQDRCTGEMLPTDFEVVSFHDVAAILHNRPTANSLACLTESFPKHFMARGRYVAQIIHESGHAIFGLQDEYCGETTSYEQNDPVPNIWSSEENCRDYAESQDGWNSDNCIRIEIIVSDDEANNCQTDFWRYDDEAYDIMGVGGTSDLGPDLTIYGDELPIFGPACTKRINYVYDNWTQ